MAADPAAGPRRSGGNALTRKLGPLPVWGWLAIATVAALVLYFFTKKKSGASASSTSTVPIGQVPDYVFQNYNEIPLQATAPGAGGSANPGGTVSTEESGEHAGHWATAPGGKTFADLARQNGLSWKQLYGSGPGNAKLLNRYKGKKVPRGTRYWVPGTKNRVLEEAP